MSDSSRIEDLRRRIQKDPASIAFAQLAEELRRAGAVGEAIDVCRAGLAQHPAYLSARVTLGRALLEQNDLSGAGHEFELVLQGAPENLAALRGLGEISNRLGNLPDALGRFRLALALAKNDPDLERTVADLTKKIEHDAPPPASTPAIAVVPPPAPPPMPIEPEPPVFIEAPTVLVHDETPRAAVVAFEPPALALDLLPIDIDSEPAVHFEEPSDDPRRVRAVLTVTALEQWLDAIHGTRTEHRP